MPSPSTPTIKQINTWAALALAFSLLCVALALWAFHARQAVRGPLALGVVHDTIWIADQHNVLVADKGGHELRRFSLAALTLTQPPAAILPVSPGRVLLIERTTDRLVEVDAQQGKVLRHLNLAWPPGFGGGSIISAATSPADSAGQYDLVVSTGGLHTVLRFNSQGQFKARSAPGRYDFTNGIWYSPEGWWTTDTNRFVLRRLQLDDLTELSHIDLRERTHNQVFLGLAVPSQAQARGIAAIAQANKADMPLTTLFRHENGMLLGRVVDVFANGDELEYPLRENAKPVDLAWFGDRLLVIEGQEQRLRSFSTKRQALADFGDAKLSAYFAQARSSRLQADLLHSGGIIGALLGLLAGLFCNAWGRQVTNATASLPRPQFPVALALRLFWPAGGLLALLAVFILLKSSGLLHRLFLHPAVADSFKHAPALTMLGLLLAVLLPSLPLMCLLTRNQLRAQALPEFEHIYNRHAQDWLRHHAQVVQAVLGSGEHVREVVFGQRGHEQSPLLLTQLRVLEMGRQFVSGRVFMRRAWARNEIVTAQLVRRTLATPRLCLTLKSGECVRWQVRSAVTAQRICQLIGQRAPSRPVAPIAAHTDPADFAPTLSAPCPAPGVGSPLLQMVAAFVLPGLGQWLQRRNRVALTLFLSFALWLVFILTPALWAYLGHRAAISLATVLFTVMLGGVLCVVSAADAWQHRSVPDAEKNRREVRR